MITRWHSKPLSRPYKSFADKFCHFPRDRRAEIMAQIKGIFNTDEFWCPFLNKKKPHLSNNPKRVYLTRLWKQNAECIRVETVWKLHILTLNSWRAMRGVDRSQQGLYSGIRGKFHHLVEPLNVEWMNEWRNLGAFLLSSWQGSQSLYTFSSTAELSLTNFLVAGEISLERLLQIPQIFQARVSAGAGDIRKFPGKFWFFPSPVHDKVVFGPQDHINKSLKTLRDTGVHIPVSVSSHHVGLPILF